MLEQDVLCRNRRVGFEFEDPVTILALAREKCCFGGTHGPLELLGAESGFDSDCSHAAEVFLVALRSSARRTTTLPTCLPPRNMSMKACGAFSRPSTNDSGNLILPVLTAGATSRMKHALRFWWSKTMKPGIVILLQ